MKRRRATTLSLFELMTAYPTEADAVAYLERITWGSETTCTRCGCVGKITPQPKHLGRYWCGDCRKYFTCRTGTPLEYGKVDVRKWLFAAYLLVTARKGISSLQLSKELAVTQTTAWYMLHRLRIACGPKLEALRGTVEADETYIGGKEGNKHESKRLRPGGGPGGKVAVAGVRQRGGRVAAQPVDDTTAKTLIGFVEGNVEPGTAVYTDDSSAYESLPNMFNQFEHDTVKHGSGEYARGDVHTNGLESVWAVLKRGYHGIYHGWSRKHMRAYVDEFTFRLNDGNCAIDTQDRLDALFRGMHGKTITYAQLTA